jgi:hypothetical protein
MDEILQAGSALTPIKPPTDQKPPIRGKEKLAMKRLTGLVVITLFVLGCSVAFGQQPGNQFGYMDSSGSFLYCDYEDFSYGTALAAGIHVQQPTCGAFADGTFIGTVVSVPPSVGVPVTGPLVALADNSVDAEFGFYFGWQLEYLTKTKASNAHFGWEILLNDYQDYAVFLINWGYLSKALPPGAYGPVGQAKSNGTSYQAAVGTRGLKKSR